MSTGKYEHGKCHYTRYKITQFETVRLLPVQHLYILTDNGNKAYGTDTCYKLMYRL